MLYPNTEIYPILCYQKTVEHKTGYKLWNLLCNKGVGAEITCPCVLYLHKVGLEGYLPGKKATKKVFTYL